MQIGDKIKLTDGTRMTVLAINGKRIKVRESETGLTDWKSLVEIQGFTYMPSSYDSEVLKLRNLTQTEDGRKLLAAIQKARS